MGEIFENINENAARAKELAQHEAEELQKAADDRRARQALKRQRQRRLATVGFLLRAVLASFLMFVSCYACREALVTPQLARSVVFVVAAWIAFWGGAWVQYMFAKGGLLNVCAE